MTTVRLDYFQRSGKWYTCQEYETELVAFDEITKSAEQDFADGNFRGLSGYWYGYVVLKVIGKDGSMRHYSFIEPETEANAWD